MNYKFTFIILIASGLLFVSRTNAQTVITGIITDANTGGILPGASIKLEGSTAGVSADSKGKYTISIPSSNTKLVFSFIGYQPQEVTINGKKIINVQLVHIESSLSEVVVTALGINREKKSLGYSVSEVNSEDLVKAANPNVLKSLDGKVSGVNLTNLSRDPTSSVLVNIRGTTTLPSISSGADVSARSQPLYVIDGIPVGAQTFTAKDGVDFGNILSQLNPEDIASVTILKGGSAGAL
jgi:outer membrane receptor protein involved in Fe transport